MSPSAVAPSDVFRQLLEAITSRALDSIPALYAEDAVVEQPFHLPEPRRLVGREALRSHFGGLAALPLTFETRNVVIHETRDSSVVIGEFDYLCRLETTGRTFTAANIIVMQVMEGQIVRTRDYHNHALLQDALAELRTTVAH